MVLLPGRTVQSENLPDREEVHTLSGEERRGVGVGFVDQIDHTVGKGLTFEELGIMKLTVVAVEAIIISEFPCRQS